MSSGKSGREQRLAQALRANLRRRKGQVRERAAEDMPDLTDKDPDDEGPKADR